MRIPAAIALSALTLPACDRGAPPGTGTPAAEAGGAALTEAAPASSGAGAYGAQAGPTSMPAGHPGAGWMPPGHPAAGGMPPGHPGAGGMPPGHPGAGGMPPGHGDPHAGLDAGGDAALAAGQPAPPLGDVTGAISLGPGLAEAFKPGSVLFVTARRDAGPAAKGALLAAKKVLVADAKSFPLAYALTQADVMMPGDALAGVVRVGARLDQDGDALTKTPGDIEGAAPTPVTAGATGVDFALDTKL